MPIVKAPDGKNIKFPDDFSPERITVEMSKLYSPKADDRSWISKIVTPEGHGEPKDPKMIELVREAPERVKREMMDVPETYGEAAAQTEGLIRPVLEGTGQLGGELGGAYLGALTSPITGPVGPIAGATAGGGGGYAAGSWLADILYGTDKADLQKDLLTGGVTSGIGAAIGPLAKATFGFIPSKTIRAGKQFYDAASGKVGNFLGKADELISQIPGFEPMLGQSGEEIGLTSLARKVLNTGDDRLLKAYDERLLEQNKAMKRYLRKSMPSGQVDDLIKVADEVREKIARGVDVPTEQLQTLADSIALRRNPDEYSKEVMDLLREAQNTMYKTAKKKWDNLPNEMVGKNTLEIGLRELRKELALDSLEGDLPKALMKTIDSVPISQDIPMSQLRRWRSNASNLAYEAERGSSAQKAAKKLQLKIEEVMDNMFGDMPDYREARRSWRKYKDAFYDGPVGKALDYKKGLTDLKAIQGMYNPADPQKAESILKALGPEKGRETIKNIALSDLRDAAYLKDSGGILDYKKAGNWFDKNRNLLERYDLVDDFKNYKQLGQRISEAEKNNADFQKMILSKVTKKNPKEIISSLLSSSESGKDTIRLMSELNQTKDGPAAIAGLRSAFKEHALTNASGKDGILDGGELNKVLKKYEPIMKVLWSDPGDRSALYGLRQLLKFNEELFPGGTFKDPNIITKLSRGRDIAGGSATGWVDIISKLYNRIGRKKLEEGFFDPKVARELMKKFEGMRNIATGIAGTGATYSAPLDTFLDVRTVR